MSSMPVREGVPFQLHPTGSGIVSPDPDWRVPGPKVGPGFIAYMLTDGQFDPIGQMLGIPSGNGQPNWAARQAQDGYRWSALPFPDVFGMMPLKDGHAHNLAAAATWYQQAWLQLLTGPPTGPGLLDKMWRITHKPLPVLTEELVGFLIRAPGGASMRWVVRSDKVFVKDGFRGLPEGSMKFVRIESTNFPDGPYEEAIETQVV